MGVKIYCLFYEHIFRIKIVSVHVTNVDLFTSNCFCGKGDYVFF